MNLIDMASATVEDNKVYVIRLHNGVLLAAQSGGFDEESNSFLLENPCFVAIDANSDVHMEPFIHQSLVKTINGPINADHILMAWEASDSYAAYYTNVITEFAFKLANKKNMTFTQDTSASTKSVETANSTNNVIEFSKFRQYQKNDEPEGSQSVEDEDPEPPSDEPPSDAA